MILKMVLKIKQKKHCNNIVDHHGMEVYKYFDDWIIFQRHRDIHQNHLHLKMLNMSLVLQ